MSLKEGIKLMHNYCKVDEDVQNNASCFDEISEENLKYLVENCNEPVVLNNVLKWKMLKWNLSDWCCVLENENLPCRCGKNTFTDKPQWETTTVKKNLSITNFVELKNCKNPKEWIYFDYKYLKDWIVNKEKLKEDICWKNFGYPSVGLEESTIWIGSKGAHTPCHIDTYGCNLIAQVLGRKLWCLFPPTENLQPTRIPYEESTIFSGLNFFSPKLNDFKGVKNSRVVILSPGDVLFVPHGWWHYVENLELSISINTWLPSPKDEEKRLEESIVKMIMYQFVSGLSEEEIKNISIENSEDIMLRNLNLKYNLNVTNFCLKSYQNYMTKKSEEQVSPELKKHFSVAEILQKYKNKVQVVPILSQDEFLNFLIKQQKFENCENCDRPEDSNEISNILAAILKPNVINAIKENLLRI